MSSITPELDIIEGAVELGDETTAKTYAVEALTNRGLKVDATNLRATLKDGHWIVTGTVTKDDGQFTNALVAFDVSREGDTDKWRVHEVVIDD